MAHFISFLAVGNGLIPLDRTAPDSLRIAIPGRRSSPTGRTAFSRCGGIHDHLREVGIDGHLLGRNLRGGPGRRAAGGSLCRIVSAVLRRIPLFARLCALEGGTPPPPASAPDRSGNPPRD